MARRQVDDQPPNLALAHRGKLGGDHFDMPVCPELSLRVELGERALSEALNEPVIVAENGGRRTISKRQAIIKQLVNQSAKGDWRATKLLLDIQLDIEHRSEPQTAESSFGSADDKVIEQLKARLRRNKPVSDD